MDDQNSPKASESLATKFYQLVVGLVRRFSGGSQKEEPTSILAPQELPKGLQGLSRVASQLLSSNQDVQRVARIRVAKILKSLPAGDSWWFSSNSLGYVSQDWHVMKANQVEAVAGDPTDDAYPWVLGLLSRHDSGYVRHKAVKLLSNLSDGHELPFLLVRQNDWVDAVAKEAQKAVKKRIHDPYAAHLVTSLPVIAHLSACSRHDHSNLLKDVSGLLVADRYAQLLSDVFATTSRHVQLFLMQQCISLEGTHQERFLAACMKSSDPVICSWGCRQACHVHSGEKLYQVLMDWTSHPFVVARKEAMQEVARHFPTRGQSLWRQSLLDANRSIRELARYWAIQQGMTEQDIREVYRSHLGSPIHALSALSGLSEVVREQEVSIFYDYLKHPRARFRQVAVCGFCNTMNDRVIEAILPLLWDPSPVVVREVATALLPMAPLLDPHFLRGIAVGGPHKQGRLQAIKLLAAQGKWRCIPFLLRVAAEGDAVASSQAEEAITTWLDSAKFNTSFLPPQKQERQDILSAVIEFQDRVSPSLMKIVVRAIQSV